MPERAEILIVGGGLVGTSLALALDTMGRDVTLIEAMPSRPAPSDDHNERNLVLARASVNALAALGVWPALDAAAGVIRTVEVSRAGEFGRVRMTAAEMGVAALGRVVPGSVLASGLDARLGACRHVQRLAPATLQSLQPIAGGWRAAISVDGSGRTLDARLVVGADGSASSVRNFVGIAAREHDYGQSLFVATVACDRDIPECAFERFTDAGPVALLPLPNQRRGLVLTVAADRHDATVMLDDAAFVALAQRRFGWKLGRLSQPGRRFPHRIRRVLAASLTAPRAVLVGNAAQTVHPIGAQGFNLGLRDALTLAEGVRGAKDPGDLALLRMYAARRQPDRAGVLAFSHGLVSLACLAQPALAPLRSLSLVTLDAVAPLRHAVARHGMGFRGSPPAAALGTGP